MKNQLIYINLLKFTPLPLRSIAFFCLFTKYLLVISQLLGYTCLGHGAAHLPIFPRSGGHQPKYKCQNHFSYRMHISLHTFGHPSNYKLHFHAFDYLANPQHTLDHRSKSKCHALQSDC